MPLKYNVHVLKEAVKLLKEYETQKVLCPAEFINSKNLTELPEEVYIIYLGLMKHVGFFDELSVEFLEQYQLKKTNKWIIESFMYLLIFVLEESNYYDIKSVFFNIHNKYTYKITEFLIQEENQIFCARTGCKYFDKDYILENVVYSLLRNEKLLMLMAKQLCIEINKRESVTPKEATIPVAPSCLKRKSSPLARVERFSQSSFRALKIPNYRNQSKRLEKSLIKAKDRNWEKAVRLLDEAQRNPFKCAYRKKQVKEKEEPEKYSFRSNKVPSFKTKIPIKKTNATLMREAALLAKNRENEIQKLDKLLNGAFDNSKLEEMEEEIRKCKEQEHVQNIERNHLQGLLTFEEAQIAKKKLLQANQEKMEKFKEERLKILAEIFDWKENESEKIRTLVEKSHSIEKSAKEAEKRLLEVKQCNAKLIDYESKKRLQEIHQKREEELTEKVKLIQELRTLQQLRSLNVKQFDPTESPNFGLLCEMSIAELRQRLNALNIEMQEELKERKRCVAAERQRKELLIDNVKEFISQSRMSKSKSVPNAPPKLEQNSEIISLRERLQRARELNAVKSLQSCTPCI